MTAALVSIISRVMTSQHFSLYNSITFISISIASIPVPATHFLNNTERLKQLLKLTKETDSFYLQKRNISEDYDPLGAYAFENWKQYFNDEIRGRYETLHEDLLYTSNRQSFEKAIQAFEFISHLFASIGE